MGYTWKARHYTWTASLRKYEKRTSSPLLGGLFEYSTAGQEAVASVVAVRYMGAPKTHASGHTRK
jgi:hypothetical protein